MKVVLLNKTDVGGGAAVAANRLNKALRSIGIDSTLLVQDHIRQQEGVSGAGYGFTYRQKAFGRFLWERLRFLPHEKDASIRFGFSPANTGMDITEHTLIKEADIIHLHWINQGFISLEGLDKLFKMGKPIVWTQHDMWTFTGGCHYSGSCQHYLKHCKSCPFLRKPGKEDLSAQLFDSKQSIYNAIPMSIVACSKWMGGLAQQSSLLKDKSTYSIPNPIDTEFYKPLNQQDQRVQLGLPTDKKLILFGAANVNDPRKGMRYFLEALNILNNHYPRAHEEVELVVFGKMKENVLKQLPFKVHAFNFISDPEMLVSIYNATNIFVLPSLQDNLPNTVMEALSCGTPVVAFSTGGVPEMVNHKISGYLAKVRNAMSLADGLYDSLFKADLNAYSLAARNKVIETYSEKIVAQQYLEVYQSMLQP